MDRRPVYYWDSLFVLSCAGVVNGWMDKLDRFRSGTTANLARDHHGSPDWPAGAAYGPSYCQVEVFQDWGAAVWDPASIQTEPAS